MRRATSWMLGLCFGCSTPHPPSAPAPIASSPQPTATSEAEPAPPATAAEPHREPTPEPAHEPAAPAPIEPVPPLVDESGKTLPQTDVLPSTESLSFRRRLELLVEAIRTDDPDLAVPAFFPVLAYAEVKDIAKPERDWQHRLIGAFNRNVHEYHRQLGAAASSIQLRGIEVPEAKVKFMKPGSEGNKLGYHRVLRSRLLLGTPDGRELALEITSMISWRGEWYVVHLHGFE